MNGVTCQVVVIGDIHLHQDGRRAQRLASWDRIIATGHELPRLGAWVLLGDLFDAKSTAADRNDATQRVQAMADLAPVVILRGNHDGPGELDVFARLAARWPIRVVETPDCPRVALPQGGHLTLACVPYPFKGVLASMGLSPDEILTAADGALLDICRALRGEVGEAIEDGDAVLFAAHANISGAITSSGQPNIGREISLTSQHLELFDGMPRLLGHIHKAQIIHGATYAGSVARQSYGEIEDKRFLIVTFGPEPGGYNVFSRDLDVPPMFHVEGELTRDGFSWRLHDPADPDVIHVEEPDFAGAEVRVRYRFKQSEQCVLNHDQVRRPFAEARDLKVEPIAVPDRALRAPEVVQAVTLAEKVVAWAQLTGNVAGDSVLEKLVALKTLDEATIRAGIETWLAQAEGELARERAA